MVFKFQGADRMGDAFDRVRLAVRVIIARIDRPFGAGARMLGVEEGNSSGSRPTARVRAAIASRDSAVSTGPSAESGMVSGIGTRTLTIEADSGYVH